MFDKGDYRRRRRIKRPAPYRNSVSLPKPLFADPSCSFNQFLGGKDYSGSYAYSSQNYQNYFGASYGSWPLSHTPSTLGSPLNSYFNNLTHSYSSCQRPSVSSMPPLGSPYYPQTPAPSLPQSSPYTPHHQPGLREGISPGSLTGSNGSLGGTGSSSLTGSGSVTGGYPHPFPCRQQNEGASSMSHYSSYWGDRQQL